MMLVEEIIVFDVVFLVVEFRDYLWLGLGFSDDVLQDLVLGVFLWVVMVVIEVWIDKIFIQCVFFWMVIWWCDVVEQFLLVVFIGLIDQVVMVDLVGVEEVV